MNLKFKNNFFSPISALSLALVFCTVALRNHHHVSATITGFSLIDADMDTEIWDNIVDGQIFRQSSVGDALSVVAVVDDPANTASVRLYLNGFFIREENKPPYALGGNYDADYVTISKFSKVGTYNVTAEQKDLNGVIVDIAAVTFDISDREMEPTSAPIDMKEPTSAPIEAEAPTVEPLATDEPTMKPVAVDEPSMEPAEEPTMKPVAGDEPTMAPAEEPTMKPVAAEEPTMKPVAVDEPTLKPVANDDLIVMIDSKENNGDSTMFSITSQTGWTSLFSTGKPVDNAGLYGETFQSHRYGSDFSYTIHNLAIDEPHKVILGFAEIYDGNCIVGARVFDIFINGQEVASDLDVFDAVGCRTALTVTGDAIYTTLEGELIIELTASKNLAFVSFLQIEKEATNPVSAPSTQAPTRSPTTPAPPTPSPTILAPPTPSPSTPVPSILPTPTPAAPTPSPTTPIAPTPSPTTPIAPTPSPTMPIPPTPSPTPSPTILAPPTPSPSTPVPSTPPTPTPTPTPAAPTPSPTTPIAPTPSPTMPIPPTPTPIVLSRHKLVRVRHCPKWNHIVPKELKCMSSLVPHSFSASIIFTCKITVFILVSEVELNTRTTSHDTAPQYFLSDIVMRNVY